MGVSRLAKLLAPSSIAFVGGERARLAATQTAEFGFEGPMWLVHPDGEFPLLSDLPSVPDAVFVGVPAPTSVAVVEEAARLGVRGAVVYAAGFAETGEEGQVRQTKLISVADGMPLIGPNCHGFVNARVGAVLWPDVHGCERVERGVAIVTQSGNLAIDLTMQQRSLPIAQVISLGNQADVSCAECVEMLVADPTITAVGVHIEELTDPQRFARACVSAERLGKTIVVLKTGTSSTGASITSSHTASLAGPAAAYVAFFARYGAVKVATPDEMLGVLTVAHTGQVPAGNRIVSLSCSGGEASLMADLSENLDLEFPAFSDSAATELDRILDGKVAINNPLDYHTFIWGDAARMSLCFRSALADGVDVGVLVIDFPSPGVADDTWWPTVESFVDAVQFTGVSGIVTSTLADNLPQRVCRYLLESGIAPIPGLANCLAVLDRFGIRRRPSSELHERPHSVSTRSRLDEYEGKERLRALGLPVPPGLPATTSAAAGVANELGYPVVVKSLAVTHRSEVGGVAVGLKDATELAIAVARMESLGDHLLVERMIPDVVAELLVGIRLDEPIGWSLTLAAGGVTAELIADSATVLLPISRTEVGEVLASLRVSKLISGWRSAPAGDLEAAVTAILRLAEVAVAERCEIEINPMLVCTEGVWLADTLMDELT